MINTGQCAREFLDDRVEQTNATGRYEAAILCSDGDHVERLRARGHRVHTVDTPRNLAPLRIAVATVRTFLLLRKHRIDVLHTHSQVVGFVGRVAAFAAGTKVVVHQVHSFHHHERMPAWERGMYVLAERVLARLSDRLLFQSQSDLDECDRAAIAPERKRVLVGNGIQLERFARAIAPDAHPKVVLCVGRLEETKNQTMLFEAARLLRDRGREFVLQVVGGGSRRAEYEEWVKAHGLEGTICFLGYREDIPELTGRASVCVRVSLKEGLPRALMEAAAAGRPAVATDVGGNRDVIVEGVTGYLVPVGDSHALAERIGRLLEDSDAARRMGAAARARALALFDERVVTRAIIKVYDELLASHEGFR